MKKLFFCIGLLSVITLVSAQNDFRKGFIITPAGDTMYGMINFHGDILNSKQCTFKDHSNQITRFEPGQISGYRFMDGKYYVSKFLKNQSDSLRLLFVEYLVEGRKNLYYYRNEYGNHFLIDLRNDTLTELPYYEKMIYENRGAYLYESRNHIGYLKAYFNDCPALFKDIEKVNAPDADKLVSLTRKYHHLQCNDSNCIVYFKSYPKVNLAFEPVAGALQFHSNYIGNSGYLNVLGGFVYVWLPRSNENIYFKTGVLFPYPGDLSIKMIPLQLEYLFPGKLIHPKIDFGMEMYSEGTDITWMPSMAAGILFQLYKNLFIDADFATDLMSLNFEPVFFITHSFRAGIYYRL